MASNAQIRLRHSVRRSEQRGPRNASSISAPVCWDRVVEDLAIELIAEHGSSPQKVALRCKILLLAHAGVANATIADQLKVSRPTVLALRAAFALNGLTAATGVRRRKRSPKVLTPELEQRILDTTLKTRPGDGGTHWSVRTLAASLHVSRSTKRAESRP